MSIQIIVGMLLTITAVAGFINYKFIKMPASIGLTLVSLIISISLLILGKFGFDFVLVVGDFFNEIDFKRAVMEYMLSFLLFAGALHIDAGHMYKFRWAIFQLATIGVIISMFLIGTFIYYITDFFGIDLPVAMCYLFGALISPTDPIAVLGVLKRIEAPKSLELKIAGEALFNDGVGIVLFITILNIAAGSGDVNMYVLTQKFLQEVLGGILVGIILGKFTRLFIRTVGNFDVVLSITLAVVTGGYAVANEVLHVSGAIAMAIAGLMIGSACRQGKMPEHIVSQLEHFWEWVDELLNAILFVLIGFVVLVTLYDPNLILVSAIVIPAVLFARYMSVIIPVLAMHKFRKFRSHTIAMMTWGGLRGGVSIALALAIPQELHGREIIITMTYIVVIFSILVQGLTIGPLIKRLVAKDNAL